ncbi:DUF1330 domain-containing protein [soil metagenome]
MECMSDPIPSYAVACLRNVDLGAEIVRYMREIDDTLKPFGGEFLVHGGEVEVREGDWGDGTLILIRFPDSGAAASWYDSADYQRILPLRMANSDSITALLEGMAPGHTGGKKVTELLDAQSLTVD